MKEVIEDKRAWLVCKEGSKKRKRLRKAESVREQERVSKRLNGRVREQECERGESE